jgi:hypothetical protein
MSLATILRGRCVTEVSRKIEGLQGESNVKGKWAGVFAPHWQLGGTLSRLAGWDAGEGLEAPEDVGGE